MLKKVAGRSPSSSPSLPGGTIRLVGSSAKEGRSASAIETVRSTPATDPSAAAFSADTPSTSDFSVAAFSVAAFSVAAFSVAAFSVAASSGAVSRSAADA